MFLLLLSSVFPKKNYNDEEINDLEKPQTMNVFFLFKNSINMYVENEELACFT